jgi:hypothetical protein
MRILAQGKDDVLRFLENEALRRTNEQQGVYTLAEDDAGQLVLFIEGFTFLGSGTVSLGGNLLQVNWGSVMKAQKPS